MYDTNTGIGCSNNSLINADPRGVESMHLSNCQNIHTVYSSLCNDFFV